MTKIPASVNRYPANKRMLDVCVESMERSSYPIFIKEGAHPHKKVAITAKINTFNGFE